MKLSNKFRFTIDRFEVFCLVSALTIFSIAGIALLAVSAYAVSLGISKLF